MNYKQIADQVRKTPYGKCGPIGRALYAAITRRSALRRKR